ncbi:hypothetical protein acsn021_11390 [Anaerocolumna cellulosilytica]|uniref:Uncharacterized protein n=1 Tax=Anaerocolumna cellulosilytica TaxID=433286 RepID=A0A6S6R2M5_9FIRM|nr:hypothetical protein [Anaerocolumna cellulosilytica]MBB5194625.1 hypothetical protein [Anaerocolumna cellulosilytica]BCJ93570.1 hypothetical protein acsn021_11390 [Anaerocolumna cellulosilytica]
MKLMIEVDIDLEESGLIEKEVKDKDLLINGADFQGIGLTLKQVSYELKGNQLLHIGLLNC